MKIDVNHIAKLSRLVIDEQDQERFKNQMEAMLDLVSTLPPVEEKAVFIDPDHAMTLRPDEILPSTPRAEILKNAPQVQAGCIVVPNVME